MKLTGFVLAVKYNRCFSIEDNLGSIVDDILLHQSKLFDEKFFENVNSYPNARVLLSKKGHKMIINSDNIILEYDSKENFDNEFDKYLNAYDKIVLKEIYKNYNIQKINRFGCIFKCEMERGNTTFNKVYEFLKEETKNIESISFRYNKTTKKPSDLDGELRTDFENEIVTYDKPTTENTIKFFVDFQRYFNPPFKHIQDVKPDFVNFVKNSFKTFKDKYYGEEK